MRALLELELSFPSGGLSRSPSDNTTGDVAVAAWSALGFTVAEDATVDVGAVRVALDADASRADGTATLAAWTFEGETTGPVRLDPNVAPPTFTAREPAGTRPVSHPNGTVAFDHLVLTVPGLDTLVTVMDRFVEVPCRRRTEIRGMPAAFLRAGEVVIEAVEIRSLEAPRLWGLAFRVPDVDSAARAVRDAGGKVGDPAPALQGGRIVACPEDALFGLSVAFLETGPRSPSGPPAE